MEGPKPKLHFRHHEFLDSTTYRACCDMVDVCVNRDLLKAITEEITLKDNGLLVRFHWDTTESYSSNDLSTITLYQSEQDRKTVISPQCAVTLARSNFILHEFASEMLQVYKAKLVAVQYPHLALTFHHDKVFETSMFTSNKLQLYTLVKGLVTKCHPSKTPMCSLKIEKGSRVTLPHFTPCQCLVSPRSATFKDSLAIEAPNKQDSSSQTDLAEESSLDVGNNKEIYEAVCQNFDAKFVKMESELTNQKEHIEKHFQEQKQQADDLQSLLRSLQRNIERNLAGSIPLQQNGQSERDEDVDNLNASGGALADRATIFSGQNSSIMKRDAVKNKKEVHWDLNEEDSQREGPTVKEMTKSQVTSLSQTKSKSRSQYYTPSTSKILKMYASPAPLHSSGQSGSFVPRENMPVLHTMTPAESQYSYGQVVTEDGYTFQVSPEDLAYMQRDRADYSDLQTGALNFPITFPFYQKKKMRLEKVRCSDEADGDEIFDILVDSIIADDPNRQELRQKMNEAVTEVKKSSLPYVETVTDTILCLDTSDRMSDGTLEHMKTYAMDFINAIEDIAEQHELEENIGLVTFGGKSKVIHCLSNDYGSLRDALEEVTAEGPSHLLEGLLLSLACSSTGGQLCIGEMIKLPPRVIILTDGQENGDFTEDNEEHVRIVNAFKQFHRRQPQDYLQGDVLVIPMGKSNKSFLRAITQACGGKMIDKSNLKNLAKHQKMHLLLEKTKGCLEFGELDSLLKVTAKLRVFDMKLASYSLESMRDRSADYCCGKCSKLTLELHPDVQDHERGEIQSILKEHMNETLMSYGTIQRFDNLVMIDGLPPIGSRVIRGIDWKWKNQDTEGAGTVFNHGCDGSWVFVLWDNGIFNVYRCGRDNCYDVQLTTDQPRQPGAEQMFYTGFQVERGPDWNVTYRNQDGGPGSRGVIIREKQNIGRVLVRWNDGGIFEYRYGENNMFDISMLDPLASLIGGWDADGS